MVQNRKKIKFQFFFFKSIKEEDDEEDLLDEYSGDYLERDEQDQYGEPLDPDVNDLNLLNNKKSNNQSSSLSPLYLDENYLNTTNSQMSYSKELKNFSPVSPNKFVCIEFPLSTETAQRKSLHIVPSSGSDTSPCSQTNAPSLRPNQMSRFHSFRLDDQLYNNSKTVVSTLTTNKSNLAQNSNLSKSFLDLTNPSLIQNELRQPLNNNSIKNNESQCYSSSLETSTTSSSANSSSTSTPSSPPINKIQDQVVKASEQKSVKSRTATVVISLRKSIKRSTKKNKNESDSTPNETINNQEDNLPKIEIKSNSSQSDLNNQSIDLNNNNTKRERRDSGVGGSLTREISKRREKWGSFVKSHRPSFKSSKLQISTLTVKQYSKIKKFSLVRITALTEKYNQSGQKSSWNRFR